MDEERLDNTPDAPTDGGEKPANAHQQGMDPVEDDGAVDDASSSDDEEPAEVDFDLYDDYADINTEPDSEAYSMPLLAADFHERGISFPDALQRFNRIFRARYPAMPKELEFYPSELADAVQEAFRNGGDRTLTDGSHLPAAERRLLVIYLHTDNRASIARHLFAERVFRNDLIIDLLTERCVLWGWDVTAEKNKALLQEQMQAAKAAGLSKQVWNDVKAVLPHLYPLLIVVKGKGCSPTILAKGSTDCAEAATRLWGVIEGLQPLTNDELQVQFASDAEMARRMSDEQQPTDTYVPYYPQYELTTDCWATSPPYPTDSTIPLWRDEKGCVDDRRLVNQGVEAVPPPTPAIDFDLNEEPAVVKFAEVNVIAPRQVAYDHLSFHAAHMTFCGSKTPYDIAIAYSEVKRLFFVRGDELRIAYFVIQWNNRGDEDYVVIKLYHMQDAAKLEVDVSGIGAASLPHDFVDAVNGGSLSAGEGPIFERMADVLQLLCRKPLIVSYGFAAENAKPLIFCSIPASTGFLYPLDAGLAFISIAPHFIPYGEIAERRVELQETQQMPGRKDVVVPKKDGTQLKFSHVNQLDVDLLKAYLQAVHVEVLEVPGQ